MRFRSIITFLALIISALLFPACTGEGPPPYLRMALETEPSTLDPAAAVDYSSGMITSLVHSNLVRIDSRGRIVPDAAESWEISDDGTEYRFELGVSRFSTGRRVVAGDVLYSFRRLLLPASLSSRWWVLKPLKGAAAFNSGGEWNPRAVEVVDDSTVILRLEKPAAHFLSLLSTPPAGIVCPEEVKKGDRDYGRRPCGSGPWMLGRWVRGESVFLKPNPYFTGKDPEIDGISIRFLPVAMTRIAEFEVGNLDILDIPEAELNRWRSAGTVIRETEELRVVYIGLNVKRKPFDDPMVRRALNLAVNVEAIIARVLFGAAVKADGVIPPGLRGGAAAPEPYGYDPEEARRLLSDAGIGGGFSMELWQRESPEGGRIMQSVQAYLGEVGIEARLVTRDWSAFKEAVNQGTPDAFYLDWFADYPDPENFIAPLFHSSNTGGGGNRTGYSSGRVDSLVEAASKAADSGKRMKLLLEAERVIHRDAPWIFLWFPKRYEAVSGRLKGYEIPLIFNAQRYLDVYFQKDGI